MATCLHNVYIGACVICSRCGEHNRYPPACTDACREAAGLPPRCPPDGPGGFRLNGLTPWPPDPGPVAGRRRPLLRALCRWLHPRRMIG